MVDSGLGVVDGGGGVEWEARLGGCRGLSRHGGVRDDYVDREVDGRGRVAMDVYQLCDHGLV